MAKIIKFQLVLTWAVLFRFDSIRSTTKCNVSMVCYPNAIGPFLCVFLFFFCSIAWNEMWCQNSSELMVHYPSLSLPLSLFPTMINARAERTQIHTERKQLVHMKIMMFILNCGDANGWEFSSTSFFSPHIPQNEQLNKNKHSVDSFIAAEHLQRPMQLDRLLFRFIIICCASTNTTT